MTERLFDLVQQLAAHAIKKYPALDHKWIHDELERIQDRAFSKWSDAILPGGLLYENITRKVLLLPEITTNGHRENQYLDKNHFIIQIFRIPLEQPATLVNLLKIAMYFGFIKNTMKADDYPEGVVKLLRDFKVWSIISFINRADANMVHPDQDAEAHIIQIFS